MTDVTPNAANIDARAAVAQAWENLKPVQSRLRETSERFQAWINIDHPRQHNGTLDTAPHLIEGCKCALNVMAACMAVIDSYNVELKGLRNMMQPLDDRINVDMKNGGDGSVLRQEADFVTGNQLSLNNEINRQLGHLQHVTDLFNWFTHRFWTIYAPREVTIIRAC